MIAIPNIKKPKSCGECWFYMLDGAIDDDNRWVSYSFCDLLERTIKGNMPKDCPIIDIVTCGECKHRDPEDKKCDSGMFERQGCIFPVYDDYFCKYGERRAIANKYD